MISRAELPTNNVGKQKTKNKKQIQSPQKKTNKKWYYKPWIQHLDEKK